jgi:hypothetical protein
MLKKSEPLAQRVPRHGVLAIADTVMASTSAVPILIATAVGLTFRQAWLSGLVLRALRQGPLPPMIATDQINTGADPRSLSSIAFKGSAMSATAGPFCFVPRFSGLVPAVL